VQDFGVGSRVDDGHPWMHSEHASKRVAMGRFFDEQDRDATAWPLAHGVLADQPTVVKVSRSAVRART
jgi:hypothetical protein